MYSPSEVIATYGGLIADDFAKGTFINITDSVADRITLVKGQNRGGAFNYSADDSAIVTFTILQSSITNDGLMAKFLLIEQGLLGPEELLIEDPSGTRLCFAEEAIIMGRPNEDYGDAVGNNVWRFLCKNLTRVVGSSGR